MEHFKKMQTIYFLSENKDKFLEYQNILKTTTNVVQKNTQLIEIQSSSSLNVCKAKLAQAQKIPSVARKSFFIEDTALYFTAWNNFPGVYIKWMLETLGVQKIYQALSKFEKEATAECTIGYFSQPLKKSYFFSGKLKGHIVRPQGGKGFGWDSLFVPQNYQKSYAQMDCRQKNAISHRFLAAKKFQNFLQEHSFSPGQAIN